MREFNKPGSLSFRERSGWDPVLTGSLHRTGNMAHKERIDPVERIRTATQNGFTSHLPSNESFGYADLERDGRMNTSVSVDVGYLGTRNGTPLAATSRILSSTLSPRAGTNPSSLTQNGEESFTINAHSRTLSLTLPPQAGTNPPSLTRTSKESSIVNDLGDTGIMAHTPSLKHMSYGNKPTPRPLIVSQNDESSGFIPANEELLLPVAKPYANQYIPDVSPSFRPASAPSSLPVPSPPLTAATPTPIVKTQTTLISFPQPSAGQSPPSDISQESVNDGPTGSAIQAKPRIVIPVNFKILVQSLQTHRLKGSPQPLRSIVSLEIAKNGLTYKKAGVEKFGQYVALAEKMGLIELGGREGGAWICLKPDWYDAT